MTLREKRVMIIASGASFCLGYPVGLWAKQQGYDQGILIAVGVLLIVATLATCRLWTGKWW